MKILSILSVIFAFSAVSIQADDLVISKKGEVLLKDSLATVGKKWRTAKGEWTAAEGGVKGSEVKADKHGAVMRYPLTLKDAVIEFSFKLEGAKVATFTLNDAKEHVCRVLINKTGFQARKDDHDHAGPDKAVPFNRVKLKLDDEQWHKVVIELVGKEMVCTIDGKVSRGSHELIATEKAKPGFTVAGQSALFKDLTIWAATAK